jgi:hypothetical protein
VLLTFEVNVSDVQIMAFAPYLKPDRREPDFQQLRPLLPGEAFWPFQHAPAAMKIRLDAIITADISRHVSPLV